MGLGHNTTIARSGLVFYYDASNTQKSWRGAPTTNLIQSPTNATWNLYAFTEGGASASSSDEVQSNGYTAKVVNVTAGAGGYTNVQLYSNGIYTMTGGLTYSVSCMIWASTTCSIRIGVIKNGSPWTDYIPLTVKNLSPGWNSISTSGSFGSTVTDGRFQLDFGLAPNNTTLKVMSPQLEQNSFATPFVNGTRSNTQAILDLTNNNTITANSLTYNADGTFSFVRASSNYLNISGNTDTRFQNSRQTLSAWVNISSTGPNGYSELWNNGGNQGMTIQWRAGAIGFFIYNGSYLDYPVSVTNALNTWMNITCVIDNVARVMILYKNGVLVGTSPQWSLYTPPNGNVHIGGNFATGNGGDFTQGSIPTVQLYNRELTATEVLQNFAAQRDRYGI